MTKHGIAVTAFENDAVSTGVKSTEHNTKRPRDGQANGPWPGRIDFVGILVIGGLVMFIAGATSGSRGGLPTFGNTSLDVGPTALWGGALTGLALLVYGVFVFIFLYAYSEWMYVFMDIEENTRVTNEMLSGRR